MENKPKMSSLPDGTKRWKLNGVLHREDGPAMEFVSGTKKWYINGLIHRENGPAVEQNDGISEWYKQGKRHRIDGPAWISPISSEWWINDFEITFKIRQWAKDNNIDLNNLSEVDKLMIKLTWADYGK